MKKCPLPERSAELRVKLEAGLKIGFTYGVSGLIWKGLKNVEKS
jgi:hypothetical protein